MDWSRGFTASYYAVYLDPLAWKDLDRIEIIDGSIDRTDSDLRGTASLNVNGFDRNTERWIRIYLEARQDGEIQRIPLFTGLASAPNLEINGAHSTSPVDCYSVLKPADDILLPHGWSIAAGANGADVIRQLLNVTPAPIYISGTSPALQKTIIAEGGETHLSMVERILTSMSWRLRILGDGAIIITSKASDSGDKAFDGDTNDVIELSVTMERNWYDCPNVFRASNDEFMAVARDEDTLSIFSIPNRGREVWMEETDVQLTDNETMASYAKRRLKEEQEVNHILSYTRRFDPDLLVTDMVKIRYSTVGINGRYTINSQKIELKYGARTSEEATLWTGN